jgi:hypothetical protein
MSTRPLALISSLYDLRGLAGVFTSFVASANILEVLNKRAGCCTPLRRAVPVIAHLRRAEEGAMKATQLFRGWARTFDGSNGEGFVANVLDKICDGMRGCICEKRAPLPGHCQALAEKASGPRITDMVADRCLPESENKVRLYRSIRHGAGVVGGSMTAAPTPTRGESSGIMSNDEITLAPLIAHTCGNRADDGLNPTKSAWGVRLKDAATDLFYEIYKARETDAFTTFAVCTTSFIHASGGCMLFAT